METADTVVYRPNITASLEAGTTKLRWPHNFGAYRLTDRDLAAGSTLGSPKMQISLKATGAVEHMYCVDAGKALFGAFVVKHWDERTGMKLDPAGGHYFLYAEHQEHRYMLTNGIYVFEDVFVYSPPPGDDGSVAPAIAYYVLELTNDSEEEQRVATYGFARLTPNVEDQIDVQYDRELRGFLIKDKDGGGHARIVAASRAPNSYEVSIDHAKLVTGTWPGKLSCEINAPAGLPCGSMQFTTLLGKKESARLVFTFTLSAEDEDAVRKAHKDAPPAEKALAATQDHYHDVLEKSVAVTPNVEINRGILWAKANMERVLLKPSSGWSFTNDPMESTHSVARDAAWFCAGADYFRPEYSRECLLQFVKRQEQSGMMLEYYDMLSDEQSDYDLNINDNTPLVVWSLWHHYQVTGDDAFLDEVYDAAVKAGRYIASQRNEQGLVWCDSDKTGAHGIVGWRNVIPKYRLSGATTELNSECFVAFRAIAHMARIRKDDGTAKEFDKLAGDLRDAINEHLFNPGNGLYYLNIDIDGTPRSDITADLVFPIMFGVADRERAAHVIRRLSDRDFWTPGGMRTIPHDAINYTPDQASGCLGGVWNGVTFWYAKAAASYIPDFSEEALCNGFENYARDPQRNNTVPGQFSEWLHGETLVNQGMLLSPWFPPRYIWAVIEGLLGLDISGDRPRLAPNLPSKWQWCGLRDFVYRGRKVTWFVARVPEVHIWTNEQFESDREIDVLANDMSDTLQSSGDDVVPIAVGSEDGIVGLLGNTTDRTVTSAFRMRELPDGNYRVRRYDSLMSSWSEEQRSADELRRGLTAVISPQGFHLLETSRVV